MAQPETAGSASPLPRTLISLALGLILFTISTVVGFRWYLDSAVIYPSKFTLRGIGLAGQALEAYRQANNALPKSLADLGLKQQVDATGMPHDIWQRPLHYWTDGTRYRIFSYGRDGKPGGVGLDYDLSTNDLPRGWSAPGSAPPLPQQARPTFGQFVTDRGEYAASGSGGMMFLMCILTGAAASLLTFRTLRRGALLQWGRGWLILRLGVTVLVTFVIGWVITGLHLPSGH